MKRFRHQSINRLVIVIGFVLGINLVGLSQANTWVFGENAMINFYDGQAHPSVTPSPVTIPNGVSAISDDAGHLLLFSDGVTVKDNQFNIIENGDSLAGNWFASQSSIIVPKPGSTKLYYIFTVGFYIPNFSNDGINYSIVEFTDSGVPWVISKNNPILYENAQKIAVVNHANNTDYWVVTHGFGENKGTTFYSFLLTSSGMDTIPVTTTIGHSHTGDLNNALGSMKISPDGSKLALVIPVDGIVETYDFSTETGKVSNLSTSDSLQFPYSNGIEFSPDNSKVYFSTTPNIEDTNYIYQLNLNLTNPFLTPIVIHKYYCNYYVSDSVLGSLQMGVDGKIYVAKSGMSWQPMSNLGVIYNPNRLGVACNYNKLNNISNNGLYLEGGGGNLGLPNFVSTFLDIPKYYNTELCDKDTIIFTIRNQANIDEVNWDFGDPEGELVINSSFSPGFVFSESKSYNVNLTEFFGVEQFDYPRNIKINPLPEVIINGGADTLYFYENTTIRLDAGEWDYYNWQPGGSTERYLDVTSEGRYSVMVTDSNCCCNADTVQVIYITGINNTGSISEYITIYPNPTKGEFKIVAKGLDGMLDISIVSLTGKEYYNEEGICTNNTSFMKSIDISHFPKGVYILNISNKKGVYRSKIIHN